MAALDLKDFVHVQTAHLKDLKKWYECYYNDKYDVEITWEESKKRKRMHYAA